MGKTSLLLLWSLIFQADSPAPPDREGAHPESGLAPEIARLAEQIGAVREAVHSLEVEHTTRTVWTGQEQVQVERTQFAFWQNHVRFQICEVASEDAAAEVLRCGPVVYLDGRRQIKYWATERVARVSPLDNRAPLLLSQEYLDALAWWPYDRRLMRPLANSWFYLPDTLINFSYQFKAGTESVHGVECRVADGSNVGPGRLDDRLWLDAARGWALLQRHSQVRPNPNRQDSRMLVNYADHRPAATDLWLPWMVTTRQLRRTVNGDFAPIVTRTLTVKSLAINRLDDASSLTPRFAPGTLVQNDVTGQEGLSDSRETVLREAARRLQRFDTPDGAASRHWATRNWLWFIPVAAVLALSTLMWRSRSRRLAGALPTARRGLRAPGALAGQDISADGRL
jgi:hypothetical protein